MNIEYKGQNQVSGISGKKLKMMEGIVKVKFGKDREFYSFTIPVLVPIRKENMQIIIGRIGFFNEFKITFLESEKRMIFKKVNGQGYFI